MAADTGEVSISEPAAVAEEAVEPPAFEVVFASGRIRACETWPEVLTCVRAYTKVWGKAPAGVRLTSQPATEEISSEVTEIISLDDAREAMRAERVPHSPTVTPLTRPVIGYALPAVAAAS